MNFNYAIATFFYKVGKPAFVLFLIIQLFSTAVKGQSVNTQKDIRIRAGASSDALYGDRNFAEEAMKKVAVVYLPDHFFSYAKTGVTVFGNERELHTVPAAFTRFADSVVRQKFSALTMARFEVLNPDSLNMPDQLETLGFFKMLLTEEAKPFLDSLYKKGFDGLLVLEEQERTPNRIQYDQACQFLGSKGFYQFWNKRFLYHAVNVKVYDLETLERLKYLGFVQLSAEEYSFNKKAPILPLEPYMEALKIRFVNNIDNIIAEHKMH